MDWKGILQHQVPAAAWSSRGFGIIKSWIVPRPFPGCTIAVGCRRPLRCDFSLQQARGADPFMAVPLRFWQGGIKGFASRRKLRLLWPWDVRWRSLRLRNGLGPCRQLFCARAMHRFWRCVSPIPQPIIFPEPRREAKRSLNYVGETVS